MEQGKIFLVHQKRIRGKQKISDCWENTPYKIVSGMGKLPVYKLCIQGKDSTKVLHQNLLFLGCTDHPERETTEVVSPEGHVPDDSFHLGFVPVFKRKWY